MADQRLSVVRYNDSPLTAVVVVVVSLVVLVVSLVVLVVEILVGTALGVVAEPGPDSVTSPPSKPCTMFIM